MGLINMTPTLHLLWVAEVHFHKCLLEMMTCSDFREEDFRPCGRSVTEIFLTSQTFQDHFQRHHRVTERAQI